MRSNLFWLNDDQWRQIEPHLPTDVRGKDRVDDRRVISGILHVLKNRFVRWAERGVWERLFRELAARGRSSETQMIDATYVKSHRSAAGAKRGSRRRRLAARGAAEIRKSTQSQMLRAVFFPSC